MSVIEVNSLQYISINAVILLVKVTKATFLTYSDVAPIPMFPSFPPKPPEMCPFWGQDCADRPVPVPVAAPVLSLLLRSPQPCQHLCQTILHPKFNKNEGSTSQARSP